MISRLLGQCDAKPAIVHFDLVFYPRDDIARGDTATPDSNIGRFSLEEAMFLCQPLLELLAGRGVENIDVFLKVPS
jgi:hypothetical protein